MLGYDIDPGLSILISSLFSSTPTNELSCGPNAQLVISGSNFPAVCTRGTARTDTFRTTNAILSFA